MSPARSTRDRGDGKGESHPPSALATRLSLPRAKRASQQRQLPHGWVRASAHPEACPLPSSLPAPAEPPTSPNENSTDLLASASSPVRRSSRLRHELRQEDEQAPDDGEGEKRATDREREPTETRPSPSRPSTRPLMADEVDLLAAASLGAYAPIAMERNPRAADPVPLPSAEDETSSSSSSSSSTTSSCTSSRDSDGSASASRSASASGSDDSTGQSSATTPRGSGEVTPPSPCSPPEESEKGLMLPPSPAPTHSPSPEQFHDTQFLPAWPSAVDMAPSSSSRPVLAPVDMGMGIEVSPAHLGLAIPSTSPEKHSTVDAAPQQRPSRAKTKRSQSMSTPALERPTPPRRPSTPTPESRPPSPTPSTSSASSASSASSQRWRKRGLASWLSGGGRKAEEKDRRREKGRRTKSDDSEGFFNQLFRKKGEAADAPQVYAPVARRAAGVSPAWGGAWAGLEGRDGYTRFPFEVERAVYRLSHFKLANPRRPMREQVLVSNFMYSYLAMVQATEEATVIYPNPSSPHHHAPAQDSYQDACAPYSYAQETYWLNGYEGAPTDQYRPAAMGYGYGYGFEHPHHLSPRPDPTPTPTPTPTPIPIPIPTPTPDPQQRGGRQRSTRRSGWKGPSRGNRPGLGRTTSSRTITGSVSKPLVPQFSPDYGEESTWA